MPGAYGVTSREVGWARGVSIAEIDPTQGCDSATPTPSILPPARRGGAPGYRGCAEMARSRRRLGGLDAAPDAVIHVVSDPLPEAVLGGEVGVRLHLRAPALHDVVLHGPEPYAVALDQLAPVVADLRARVDQADGDALRKIIEGAEIDLLIGGRRARLDRPARHVGDAIADHHHGDRRQHQIALLHVARDLLEEDVEIGERVRGREPLSEVRLDMLGVLVVELVDRVEGLRLVVVLPPDGRHEEIARLREAAELVHVTVEVVGDERERVVICGSEGSAGVEADEQGRPRRLAGFRLRRRDHDGGAEESRGDQASGEREASATHSVAGFRGGVCRCKFCKICQVCVTSLPSLKGSEKTCREDTRTIPKLTAAAAIWRTGSTR